MPEVSCLHPIPTSSRDVTKTLDFFYYFTVPGVIIADDGVVSKATASEGGVVISSQPFTQSLPPLPEVGPSPVGTLDHPKFLALSRCAFPVEGRTDRETYFEMRASAFTRNTQLNPFGEPFVSDPYDDPRLAAAGLVTIELELNMVADVLYTNGGVYALYERLENGRTADSNYASFTNVVKVATRDRFNPTEDVVTIGVGWSSAAIRWYVNRREVYRVDRIGFRPPDHRQTVIIDRGGEDRLVVPTKVNAGFGTFSLLDGFPANNYAGTFKPALVRLSSVPNIYRNPFRVDPVTGNYPPLEDDDFVDPENLPTSRIFNSSGTEPTQVSQGATLIVRNLLVALRPVFKSL
ncbi:hypothetical protein ml_494 [Mollivirus sibericum]|uniref:hypothetical protein n=1 Tax=Mollivirus sibericum TaxID=1678078 RepID=UPI0006B2E4DB|nr:hypothetical protein ml_494 [Mollivirus sibericum]ALD62296.1 hypothetical protein ml_494 [Mollivirus sibericum]